MQVVSSRCLSLPALARTAVAWTTVACGSDLSIRLEESAAGAVVVTFGAETHISHAELLSAEELHKVGVDPSDRIVVFSFEAGGLTDQNGAELTSFDGISTAEGPSSCGARALDWPLLLGPGDRCPLPAASRGAAYRLSDSLVLADEAGESLIQLAKSSIRLVREGERELFPAPEITLDGLRSCPLAPRDAFHIDGISIASNGYAAAVAPGHLILIPPHHPSVLSSAGPSDSGPILALSDGVVFSDQGQLGTIGFADARGSETLRISAIPELLPSALGFDESEDRVYVAGGVPTPASGARRPAMASCTRPRLGGRVECREEPLLRRHCAARRLVDVALLPGGRGVALGEGSEPYVRSSSDGSWTCRSGPVPTQYQGAPLDLDDAFEASIAVVDDVAFFCSRARTDRPGAAVFRAPLSFDDQPIPVELVHFEPGASCTAAGEVDGLARLTLREGLVVDFSAAGELLARHERAGSESLYPELGASIRRLAVSGAHSIAELATTALSTRAADAPFRPVFGPPSLDGVYRLAAGESDVVAFGADIVRLSPRGCESMVTPLGSFLPGAQPLAATAVSTGFLVSGSVDGEGFVVSIEENGAAGAIQPTERPITKLATLSSGWVVGLDDSGQILASNGGAFDPIPLIFDDPLTEATEPMTEAAYVDLDAGRGVAWAVGGRAVARILPTARGPRAETFWLPYVVPSNVRAEFPKDPPNFAAVRVVAGDRLQLGLRGVWIAPGTNAETTRSMGASVSGDDSADGLASVELNETNLGEDPIALGGPAGELTILTDGRFLLEGGYRFSSVGRGVLGAQTVGGMTFLADARGVVGVVFEEAE
ncbi:MAG: hypothetical protein HY791_01380 [Deltaproteobacteria bacterium]|nr:hypothetical protein [Deltaproteobacteria bacterium]